MAIDSAPALLKGDRRGILCVHGFTGTPFEVRALANSLHENGPTVRVPRLPGHGTTPRELDQTHWRDWVACVRNEFEELANTCDKVFVVGQSLGGLLTLDLAMEVGPRVSGIAVLATPLWLPPLPTAVIRAARRFPALTSLVPRVPKLGGSDVRDATAKSQNPSYPVIPTKALLVFSEFMERVRSRLERVSAPTLIVHAPQDHTAPFACASELAARLGSNHVETVSLQDSFHLIAFDVEQRKVASEVWRFAAPLLT